MSKKYQESGVSLERGYETIHRIKSHVKRTNNLGVMSDIGSFGGLFDLSKYQIKEPVLVSGTDGVGTKLLIAQEANIHDTIGIDLVAMCVNDVLTQLAKPLFFLDYIATGKLEPEVAEKIVQGISNGCIESGCALIGGETAEMPDMYSKNHYDLAGYVTAVVEKNEILKPEDVKEFDILLGLPSSGLHSNGFSLVRKVLFKDHSLSLNDYIPELEKTLVEELLTPTKIYVKTIELIKSVAKIHGISHITGGGFIENIPRMLPAGLGVELNIDYKIPAIFNYLEKLGKIDHSEMFNIFNMGIGLVIALDQENADKAIEILRRNHEPYVVLGRVSNKEGVIINE